MRLGHRGGGGSFYGVSVTLHGIEPRRSPARRSRLWLLIGWSGGRRWHGVFCRSGWRGGCYTGVRRKGAGLSGSANETRGEISQRREWSFGRRHWFRKVWLSEFGRFGMVDVDGTFHISILVDHLVFIWDAADAVGPFPSRCQLGSAFWRSGQSEDEAANLVGVSSRRRWWGGHLLVSELKPLLEGLNVSGGVLSGGGRIGIQVEVWRKRWLAACCNHGGRESVRFVRHSVEG